MIKSGEGLLIPPNVPHEMAATEDTVFLDLFAPAREDWLKGDDQYLRR
jgi:quercetin dioxygenase-like cupin family protein